MQKKIDGYTQQPFQTQTTQLARQHLGDPKKDPLFYEADRLEEYKNLGSSLTAEHIVKLVATDARAEQAPDLQQESGASHHM